MELDEKVTNIGNELNLTFSDTNLLTQLKEVARKAENRVENEREKIRSALQQKGIDDRNRVLTRDRLDQTQHTNSQ